jgi:aminoglycoside 2'-N-acetyltransferase I
MTDVVTAHTSDLDEATRASARQLLYDVFDDMTEHDWEHSLDGIHALAWAGEEPVAHASVIQRRLLHGGRALRAGYLEGVAVRADHRHRGHGAALMTALERVTRRAYDVGALGATDEGAEFHLSRGWQLWRGPTSAHTPTVVRRTEEDDGCIHVPPLGARCPARQPLPGPGHRHALSAPSLRRTRPPAPPHPRLLRHRADLPVTRPTKHRSRVGIPSDAVVCKISDGQHTSTAMTGRTESNVGTAESDHPASRSSRWRGVCSRTSPWPRRSCCLGARRQAALQGVHLQGVHLPRANPGVLHHDVGRVSCVDVRPQRERLHLDVQQHSLAMKEASCPWLKVVTACKATTAATRIEWVPSWWRPASASRSAGSTAAAAAERLCLK